MADQPPMDLFNGICTFGGVSYLVWGTMNPDHNYGQSFGALRHNGVYNGVYTGVIYVMAGRPMQDGGGGNGGGGDGDGGNGPRRPYRHFSRQPR